MRIFDPHVHMTSRTTDDYTAMADAGIRAVVEPSFWLGQPRTSVGSLVDYFDSLLGWEPFCAAQFGVTHHCAIALNPKEANDPRLVEALDLLPRYLLKDGVVAVGEVGYDSMTKAEDDALAAQLALAREHRLPVLVHTPHRDKVTGTRRTLDVIREAGVDPSWVLLDHLNELTVEIAQDSGCWMGFSIYPDTKMSEARVVRLLARHGTARILVNSAADWGRSDPLKTRRTAEAMLAAGFTESDVDQVCWRNPVDFFARSGRLLLDPEPVTHDSFAGNSIERGERAGDACDSDIPTAAACTSPTARMPMPRRSFPSFSGTSPAMPSRSGSDWERAGSDSGFGWPPRC